MQRGNKTIQYLSQWSWNTRRLMYYYISMFFLVTVFAILSSHAPSFWLQFNLWRGSRLSAVNSTSHFIRCRRSIVPFNRLSFYSSSSYLLVVRLRHIQRFIAISSVCSDVVQYCAFTHLAAFSATQIVTKYPSFIARLSLCLCCVYNFR